jgi:RNA polymerase sigma-70 factor (ECF subfamily)
LKNKASQPQLIGGRGALHGQSAKETTRPDKSTLNQKELLIVNFKPLISYTRDFQLVDAARKGDREAFGELIEKYHYRCVDLAASLLRDRGEAEEETQNACWKAFCRLDQFHGESEFSSWLYRIVRNQCLMRIRSRHGWHCVSLDDLGPDNQREPIQLHATGLNPEGELGSREVARVLRQEISRMPSVWRDVIVMRDVKEMAIADLAARLGISVLAAKSRLLRARTELRRRMTRHCGRTGASVLMTKSAA